MVKLPAQPKKTKRGSCHQGFKDQPTNYLGSNPRDQKHTHVATSALKSQQFQLNFLYEKRRLWNTANRRWKAHLYSEILLQSNTPSSKEFTGHAFKSKKQGVVQKIQKKNQTAIKSAHTDDGIEIESCHPGNQGRDCFRRWLLRAYLPWLIKILSTLHFRRSFCRPLLKLKPPPQEGLL